MATSYICGPCSVESYEQVMTCAEAISKMGVEVLRAGVWKPRTLPGQFEGKGEDALQWLNSAKARYGLRIATEVALPKHVELCLRYGIDLVWMGARTTASPFAVDELCTALSGTGITIYVKNPINPDINLWIGAIQRLQSANVHVGGAIHRGFSVSGQTYYRNPPLWQIANELRQRMPGISLIGDPSHMAGKAELVPLIARQFINRGYDGLMIECHPSPEKALTDARQQLTLNETAALLTSLQLVDSTSSSNELQRLRERIDDIDDRLLTLVAERLSTVERLGAYKQEHRLAFSQPERFRDMLKERLKWCETHGIRPAFAEHLFELIQQESILRQKEITGI